MAIDFAEIFVLAQREHLLVARERHAHKDQRVARHQGETQHDRPDSNPLLPSPECNKDKQHQQR